MSCKAWSSRRNVYVGSRASDDLDNPDKIRTLLKDLREARQAKSREGLKTLDHSELSVCNHNIFSENFTDINTVAQPLLHGNQ